MRLPLDNTTHLHSTSSVQQQIVSHFVVWTVELLSSEPLFSFTKRFDILGVETA